MKLTAIVVFIVAGLLLVTAAPSGAVGPDDGIWYVIESHPLYGAFAFYASVHQNGTTVVTINVNQATGGWTFGIGTRVANTVSGTFFDSNGVPGGTGTITLTSGSTFVGQAVFDGAVWSLTGAKVF